MHTIEHLFATYARNSEYGDNVIYFGPMGCRTGFYFLTRGIDNAAALGLIKNTLNKCALHTWDIPGNSAKECGNYLDHNLNDAKKYAKNWVEGISKKGWNCYIN